MNRFPYLVVCDYKGSKIRYLVVAKSEARAVTAVSYHVYNLGIKEDLPYTTFLLTQEEYLHERIISGVPVIDTKGREVTVA